MDNVPNRNPPDPGGALQAIDMPTPEQLKRKGDWRLMIDDAPPESGGLQLGAVIALLQPDDLLLDDLEFNRELMRGLENDGLHRLVSQPTRRRMDLHHLQGNRLSRFLDPGDGFVSGHAPP